MFRFSRTQLQAVHQQKARAQPTNPKRPDPQILNVEMIVLILQNNCFEFDGIYYIQTRGTAMGAPFGIKFANIVMYMVLRHIIPSHIIIYRLMDNLFFVWPSSDEALSQFVNQLNNHRTWLKFTQVSSLTKVPFLDIVVNKNGDKLATTLYIKPTDRQQFLHSTSCHPKHLKNFLPYSQALRYRRNISDETQLQKHLDNLTNDFTKRGYKRPEVSKAAKILRQQTLTYKQKSSAMDRIPFVFLFLPNMDQLKPVIRALWE